MEYEESIFSEKADEISANVKRRTPYYNTATAKEVRPIFDKLLECKETLGIKTSEELWQKRSILKIITISAEREGLSTSALETKLRNGLRFLADQFASVGENKYRILLTELAFKQLVSGVTVCWKVQNPRELKGRYHEQTISEDTMDTYTKSIPTVLTSAEFLSEVENWILKGKIDMLALNINGIPAAIVKEGEDKLLSAGATPLVIGGQLRAVDTIEEIKPGE